MINRTYGLIPTEDGSLPCDGIEFKTPIYNGLKGLRKLFSSFEKYVDFSNESCGQHINIGDTEEINAVSTHKIRSHASLLFNPLYYYMDENTDDTIKVCGRFFTDYADRCSSYSDHDSWIALSESQRIEFRLSKFVTPDQYFELTCMWTEMIDCIVANFIPINDDQSAKDTALLLIEIFKKYVDRQAKCQQYKRTPKVKVKKSIKAKRKVA